MSRYVYVSSLVLDLQLALSLYFWETHTSTTAKFSTAVAMASRVDPLICFKSIHTLYPADCSLSFTSTCDLDEPYTWAPDMGMLSWSVGILFWQLLIHYIIAIQYES